MIPRLKGGLPTAQSSVSFSASLVSTQTSGPLRTISGVTKLPEAGETSLGSLQACSFLSLMSRMHHDMKRSITSHSDLLVHLMVTHVYFDLGKTRVWQTLVTVVFEETQELVILSRK